MDTELPPPLTELYVPNQDERTMATLAHALQMVGGWIAPLIIFFTKRESKFISFHALQVLFLQIVYFVAIMVGMVFWFAGMFAILFHQQATHANTQDPPVALFVFLPIFWLAMMGGWITILVATIVYAIKAGRGEWAEIPVVGKWAKRVLHI